MSSFKAFDIAGSGMAAQSVRLNTTASNLANADSVSGDPAKVYKARHPIFEAVRHARGARRGRAVRRRGQGARHLRIHGAAPTRATSRAIRSRTPRASCTRPRSTWSRRWST